MDQSELSLDKRIGIIGAGLAGTMMAGLFSKLGFTVSLYEKRDLSGNVKSCDISFLIIYSKYLSG